MILAWGKCAVKIKDANGGTVVHTFDQIVEGSTSLEGSEGDKKEAKIEGGEVVAVRYGATTYELTFQERLSDSKQEPTIWENGGVISGEHHVEVIPEDPAAPGCVLPCCHLNVSPSYSAEEGFIVTYKCSAQKPSTANGDAVEFTAPRGK